jgi:predicted type IV restriction endonuclease
MSTPKEKAREQIDQQLNAAGWVVQDPNEINIAASRGVPKFLLSRHFHYFSYV